MRKLKLIFIYTIFIIIFLLTTFKILDLKTEKYAHYTPNYEKEDLMNTLQKNTLSEDDYAFLFRQTGLAKPAIEEIKNLNSKTDYINSIKEYQNTFFKPIHSCCKQFIFTTSQEYITDSNDQIISGFKLAPCKTGDIILTKNSHSFGWRHGHAGLIVDADSGQTLESFKLNTNSEFGNLEGWTSFPSIIVLRLKDTNQMERNEIAKKAKTKLYGIPYLLTTGITTSKYMKEDNIKGTQCAHMVWEAFRLFGYDLDSTGRNIVTVKDLATSPLLEIVQIYGINPDNIWE